VYKNGEHPLDIIKRFKRAIALVLLGITGLPEGDIHAQRFNNYRAVGK
jgi:hypothetical protein